MKKRLGILPFLLALGASSAQAQTFPADDAYVPFLCGNPGTLASDPSGDEPNDSIDIVGNATSFAYAWHVDATGDFAYFRMRLAVTPIMNGQYRQFGWSFAVDTDQNVANGPERRVILDGVREVIEIVDPAGNTVGVNTYDPATYARVTPAGTTIGGGADVFLTFAMPYDDLVAAGVVGNLRIWAGTSTNSTGFSKDAACANNVTDTTIIVVPPTPTCGNTMSAGQDLGCTAITPVCDFGSGAPTCEVCEDNTAGGTDFSCPATASGGACITSVPWARPVCGECTVDADCLVGTCDQNTNACVILCMDDTVGGTDTGCSAMAPQCQELGGGQGICLACEDTANTGLDNGCASGAPACNTTTTPICVTCTDDGDGAADHGCETMGAPACDATGVAPTCVECTVDTDCAAGVCSNNACVPCVDDSIASTDSGCSMNTPFCDDSSTPVCVECLGDANCPGGACLAGACVPCVDSASGAADTGCGDVSDAGPVCSGSGAGATCVPCETTNDFGCMGGLPVCDTSGVVPECVACVVDGDCAAGVCESNVCVGCRDDGLGVDDGCGGNLPVCDTAAAPTCTACADSGMGLDDGCDAATPNCDETGTPVCVQCLTNADCGADLCVGGMCTTACTDTGVGVDMGCDMTTPVCITANAASFCVACNDSGDGVVDDGCVSQNPACNPARTCIECTTDADCDEGVCSAFGTCVACQDTANGGTDAGCDATSPVCAGAGEAAMCVTCEDTGDTLDFGCEAATPTCLIGASGRTCVECADDSQCPGALVCDLTTFTCGPECMSDVDCTMEVCDLGTCEECVDDLDCGRGNRCVASQCEPVCTSNDQCEFPTPVCDVPNTTCVECTDSTHCATGEVCNVAINECVPGCDDDGDCSNPLPVCDTTAGACTECVDDGDCASNVCIANQCEECRVDSDCADGDVCAADNTCVGCTVDVDCGVGEVCDILLSECTTGCTTDADCLDPRLPVCLGSGVCVECDTAADCSNGELCNDNVCEPPCVTNDDCPAEHPVCSEAFVCVDCATDLDCDGTDVCRANDCVPSCTTNADCTTPALPVCNTDDGVCVLCTAEDASACSGSNAGTACVNPDTAPVCGCLTDTDCPSGSSCGENDRCTPDVIVDVPRGGLSGGAMCSTTRGSSSLPLWVALVALGAVLTRRRKR